MAEDEKMKLYELQAEIIETQERLKELTAKERQLDLKVNNIPLNEESIVVSTDLKLFEELLKAFDEQWSKRFSTMEDALQFQRMEVAALKEEQWKKEEKDKQNNVQFLRLQKIIEKQSQSIENILNDLTKIKEDQINILPKSNEKKKEEPKKKKERKKEGTFNMDNFKRIYSNEDTATKAIPHLWENFDSENNSIWKCEYKFPEELTLTFMSCNLISGMYQRLEQLKKNAFASMILFGTNNNSTISGIWIWRGQELAFPLSPDWQVDYESYEWKKLDPKSEETKKEVNEYLLWEGDFGGKKFNQGKIFK